MGAEAASREGYSRKNPYSGGGQNQNWLPTPLDSSLFPYLKLWRDNTTLLTGLSMKGGNGSQQAWSTKGWPQGHWHVSNRWDTHTTEGTTHSQCYKHKDFYWAPLHMGQTFPQYMRHRESSLGRKANRVKRQKSNLWYVRKLKQELTFNHKNVQAEYWKHI